MCYGYISRMPQCGKPKFLTETVVDAGASLLVLGYTNHKEERPTRRKLPRRCRLQYFSEIGSGQLHSDAVLTTTKEDPDADEELTEALDVGCELDVMTENSVGAMVLSVSSFSSPPSPSP